MSQNLIVLVGRSIPITSMKAYPMADMSIMVSIMDFLVCFLAMAG